MKCATKAVLDKMVWCGLYKTALNFSSHYPELLHVKMSTSVGICIVTLPLFCFVFFTFFLSFVISYVQPFHLQQFWLSFVKIKPTCLEREPLINKVCESYVNLSINSCLHLIVVSKAPVVSNLICFLWHDCLILAGSLVLPMASMQVSWGAQSHLVGSLLSLSATIWMNLCPSPSIYSFALHLNH